MTAQKPEIKAPKTPRTPWRKKTPAEVFLGETEKLRREIADMEEDLKGKRRQLQKFEEARKIIEA